MDSQWEKREKIKHSTKGESDWLPVAFSAQPPTLNNYNDAHLLGHCIQPYSSNPFGVNSFQIQVWQDLFFFSIV